MSYEVSLRQVLGNRNPSLSGRLEEIQDIAMGLLSYTQGKFPYFTPHGFSHSLNVEENLNWMIPDDVKNKMNSHEVFFLLIAAWMHDWGMVGELDENPKEIRKIHHQRTEINFQRMYDKLFLSKHEGRIAGRICKGHTKDNLYTDEFDDIVFGYNVRIRVRFLAAILRIADECDIVCNRTPEIIYYSLNPSSKSKEEFEKHLSITGIGQLDELHKIYISAVARDPKGADALRQTREKIQQEINVVKGILGQYGILFDVVELKLETRGFIDKPIAFEVDRKKLIELFVGKRLYSRDDVAIRELLQNAIDACKHRRSVESKYLPRILIYRDGDKLIFEDNGYGMDFQKASEYLSSIGTSFYASAQFRKMRDFDPISNFGIGILSCFLIAKSLEINTKAVGKDPCCFIIKDIREGWRYEKGSKQCPGTEVALQLDDHGKSVDIIDSLEHYAKAVEIPIFVGKTPKSIKKFDAKWNDRMKEINVITSNDARVQKPLSTTVIETSDFEAKIYEYNLQIPVGCMFLANQGIYIGTVSLREIGPDSSRYNILVNLKKNIVDLDVSRERIVNNENYRDFLRKFRHLFLKQLIDEARIDGKKTKYSPVKRNLLVHATILEKFNSEIISKELEDEGEIARLFMTELKFPTLTKKGLELRTLEKSMNLADRVIEYSMRWIGQYQEAPNEWYDEISVLKRQMQCELERSEIVICNFRYGLLRETQYDVVKEPLVFRLTKAYEKEYQTLHLVNTIDVSKIEDIETPLDSLLPRWCSFAEFPKHLRGIVLQTKPFKIKKRFVKQFVEKSFDYLEAFWAIETWRPSKKDTPTVKKNELLSNLTSEPHFCIDKNDQMNMLLIKKSERILSSELMKLLVSDYFKTFLLSCARFGPSLDRFLYEQSFLEKIILLELRSKVEDGHKPWPDRLGKIPRIIMERLGEVYPLIIDDT